jgi:threonine/homoserine/homoserine lactone efflux protein
VQILGSENDVGRKIPKTVPPTGEATEQKFALMSASYAFVLFIFLNAVILRTMDVIRATPEMRKLMSSVMGLLLVMLIIYILER